jgi:hypothetical protein
MQKEKRPSLYHAIKLQCLYCDKTSLLKKGNFLEFVEGCPHCNYKFEREVGYFSGASWMITYTVAALAAMISGGIMIWKFSDQSDFVIAGIPAAFGGIFALLFIPFGKSFWMYVDHLFHPLTKADQLDSKRN